MDEKEDNNFGCCHLVGVFFLSFILGALVINTIVKSIAIDYGYAYYHSKTGEFKWYDKGDTQALVGK